MDMDLRIVGWVRSSITRREDAPKMESEGAPAAWIEIAPEFAPALDDLAPGQEILLLTWLHLALRDTLKVHPRGEKAAPLRGVFSTRSPDRPNPLGLHRTRILERGQDNRLLVYPLEAVDGTPLLDIKPVSDQQEPAGPAGLAWSAKTDWGPGIPAALAERIREVCVRAETLGLNAGVNGNVSAHEGRALCITRSGAAKGRLMPGDLVALDLATGEPLSPGRASSEAGMHLAVYKSAPWARAVIHVHPPQLLALSLAYAGRDQDLPLPPLYEAEVARARLTRVAALPPGTQALAEAVGLVAARYPDDGAPRAVLMARHGLTAWGRDLGEVLTLCEELESLARIALLTLNAQAALAARGEGEQGEDGLRRPGGKDPSGSLLPN